MNKPMIGHIFGKLILIGAAPPNRYGAEQVTCQCECGTIKTYLLSNLTSGNTKSCGCRRRDVALEKAKAASAKKIRDIDTGKEWESLTDFAKEHRVAVSSVTQAIKRQGKVAGIRLEKI